MPEHNEAEFTAADLPFALYLNQRLTFDSLAALEDGFSQFSTVETNTSSTRSSGMEGEGQLGLSNAFALFGIKLGGQGFRATEQNQGGSISDEIVHTPTSLFARLRKDLSARSLIHTVAESSDLENISFGDFVEFEATLKKSPIIELLQSYSELLPLIDLFQEQPTGKGSGRNRRRLPSDNQRIAAQMKAILTVLTANGSQDVLAELSDLRAVLTTEQSYFVDETLNDIIDGSFRVFGKVTRVIKNDADESISLLRKTPLGRFESIVDGIKEMMAPTEPDAEPDYKGSTETEIFGPVLQVIPIAIFA